MATETFKISLDPLLIDKIRDVVGLYLAPPANAAAPRRRQRNLPLHPTPTAADSVTRTRPL
ncbi:hypothetical protein OH779_40170 [Actinacidiphila glaucinigra]|uniref:hypothetical protein n=1 Tax=Actinacidiphila glaucinigra TaxID=235986 RepID=UPI0038704BBF